MRVQRQTHNIEIYRGDSIYEALEVVDPDDDPVDLTGWTGFAQVRPHVDGPVLIELSVDITDAVNGGVTVNSLFSDTEHLDLSSDGVWDLQLVTNDATPNVYTAFVGSATYTDDVTIEV